MSIPKTLVCFALAAWTTPAFGQEPQPIPRDISKPERLTAGSSSQIMGVAPAGRDALYFVSDASATLDLMVQQPINSGPKTLTEGLGDIAWPQVSPDNKRIAYISFERDSTGDVCFRTLGSSKDKCLATPNSAELQVVWWDNSSLGILSRNELHDDYTFSRVPLSGGSSELIHKRNMVGLSLSPDLEWLGYIPLKRRTDGVGVTFSNRTAVGIQIEPIQTRGKNGTGVLYKPPLPGVTGYLAFSSDSKHLYFSQYLNDTNRDGQIDGDDHSVIFRVGVGKKGRKFRPMGEPEQLTSARWDCHYPAPSKDVLIATCSHDGSLDIYRLPLEGAVPAAWDKKRLVVEIEIARDLWTKLLLSGRRLALEKNAKKKAVIVREIAMIHLELGEYESAIYYADNRAPDSEKKSDALTWSKVIGALARHRREDLALIRGQLSREYVASERQRATKLREQLSGASANVALLARLAISEIESDVGDKSASLATFEAIGNDLGSPLLFPLAAERARELYGLRGDRAKLLAVYHDFAHNQTISTALRVRFAHMFVGELSRGRGKEKRKAEIKKWRAQLSDSSDLALLLDVELPLLDLSDESQEEVRKEIFSLYRKNKDPDRRRALVLSTLQAAAKAGNEYLQYQFATSWASWLGVSHPERKYAEALFRKVVLDRAYGERSQNNVGEARGYFYGTTINAGSLEGHIGFIEAYIDEGKTDLDEIYAKRFERTPDSPAYKFVKAYRIARDLSGETNKTLHDRGVSKVIKLLSETAAALPRESQVHQLWGYVLHLRARRQGSREAAVAANRQYLLALDLARDEPRLKASLLHRLGLLQASLGNHRLALQYLRDRDRLPHVRPLAELGLRVAIARSAWHAGEAGIAKEQMSKASALLDQHSKLAKFKPLVLDRLALSLSAAGDSEQARIRYNELSSVLSKSKPNREGTPLNRIKADIGLSIAAIESGEADSAIKALNDAGKRLDKSDKLEPKRDVVWHVSLLHDYRYTKLQYRALIAGLLARAYRESGDPAKAEVALQKRVALLQERLKASGADEDRLELAHAFLQLGEVIYRQERKKEALTSIESGLDLSHTFDKNTGGTVNPVGLALIAAYAELHLYGNVALSNYARDLAGELARAYSFICKFRNPRWAKHRFLFELYLTMLALPATS